MKKYLFIIIGVLLLLCIGLYGYADKQRKENKRLELNQDALLSETENYKTKSGKDAVSIQQLELTKAELEKNCKFLTQSVSDLNLKLKRVQSIATAVGQTKIEIQTVIKDSIIYVDRIPDTLQVFNWRDPWIFVNGKIKEQNVSLDISSNDTIVQVLHRIPKKFLFFKYGTKRIQQEMVSTNPHTKIVYSEYIKLK